MLYLITPTGDRLKQFELCVEMMNMQTYKEPVTWVIIDDGKNNVPTPNVKNWDIIHKKLPYEEGNTQHRNMLAGLDECDPTKKILIIEDDDYYAKNWINFMSGVLDSYQLTGMRRAKCYHMPSRSYSILKNKRHSSLCSTGFHSIERYKSIYDICQKKPLYIDLDFWHNCPRKIRPPGQKRRKKIRSLFSSPPSFGHENNVIGIKGLQIGRKGISCQHSRRLKYRDDINYSQLKRWVGPYFANKYIEMMQS